MDNRVITVSRQYGSGGRELGEAFAERYGLAFYDKELIAIAARRSGIPYPEMEKRDERAANPILFSYPDVYTNIKGYGPSTNEILFNYQAEIVRELAAQGDCVIVGRCADYILRENPRCRSVFIHADPGDRVQRVANRNSLSPAQAEALIKKADRQRRTYYGYHTDRVWGAASSYHLCLDRSKLGFETVLDLLGQLFDSIPD